MSQLCFSFCVLVSALIYNLKFHYVCSYFKSFKSFGGGEMGDRNKSKMNNFGCTIFFYKFSLILISCTTNPYITNNKINFMLFLQDWGFLMFSNLGSSDLKLGNIFVSTLP